MGEHVHSNLRANSKKAEKLPFLGLSPFRILSGGQIMNIQESRQRASPSLKRNSQPHGAGFSQVPLRSHSTG